MCVIRHLPGIATLTVYGIIIADSFLSGSPDDQITGVYFLVVALYVLWRGGRNRFAAGSMARAFFFGVAGQFACMALMLWHGLSTPGVVVTINLILASLLALSAVYYRNLDRRTRR